MTRKVHTIAQHKELHGSVKLQLVHGSAPFHYNLGDERNTRITLFAKPICLKDCNSTLTSICFFHVDCAPLCPMFIYQMVGNIQLTLYVGHRKLEPSIPMHF